MSVMCSSIACRKMLENCWLKVGVKAMTRLTASHGRDARTESSCRGLDRYCTAYCVSVQTRLDCIHAVIMDVTGQQCHRSAPAADAGHDHALAPASIPLRAPDAEEARGEPHDGA